VHLWTSDLPDRRAAVVTFRPGDLDPARVHSALEDDGIIASARNGSDRPGIRFAPHFYNMEADIDRGLEAIERYMAQGL
jgi:selenocysteine lyase/cysteine desulfurase